MKLDGTGDKVYICETITTIKAIDIHIHLLLKFPPTPFILLLLFCGKNI